MTTFKVSTTINKPVEVVVEALMNPDNFPYWTTDLERFEVIDRKPGVVGSVGRLHYLQKGRPYTMEDKLIYCEPGQKYISHVSSDAIVARVETSLRAFENKTEITITWSGRGKVFFLKLLLPFLRWKMIKQSQLDLNKFRQLVETQGSTFRK